MGMAGHERSHLHGRNLTSATFASIPMRRILIKTARTSRFQAAALGSEANELPAPLPPSPSGTQWRQSPPGSPSGSATAAVCETAVMSLARLPTACCACTSRRAPSTHEMDGRQGLRIVPRNGPPSVQLGALAALGSTSSHFAPITEHRIQFGPLFQDWKAASRRIAGRKPAARLRKRAQPLRVGLAKTLHRLDRFAP